MKKAISIILLLTLLLSLTACSFGSKSQVPESEREKLISILDDISANMRPATAGSSLVSIRLAADLVTFAATTSMDKKEAAAIVSDWLKAQTPEIRAAFDEKLESVKNSYGQILKDGAAGLLESAGVEKDLSNLGSQLKSIVEAILATGGLD